MSPPHAPSPGPDLAPGSPAPDGARTSGAPAPRVSRRTWWVLGGLGVVVGTALAIWFGISATAGKVHWYNAGFEVVSDEQVDIRFDIRRDPAREVTCDLHALDGDHARVGTGQVTVPPAQTSPTRHVEPLRTVSRAVTGYVDSCTYTD